MRLEDDPGATVRLVEQTPIFLIHFRSKHDDALPLSVTHGWPGSLIEQLKIVDPLTHPTAHGASASDAFHLVIPSIPGFGFSGKPTTTGWGPDRIARAWTELMKRLGYTRFVAQGGDWGALITDLMGLQAPPELVGIHTNMPGAIPPDIDKLLQCDITGVNNALGSLPSDLSDDEKRACEQADFGQPRGLTRDDVLDNITLFWLTNTAISAARIYA